MFERIKTGSQMGSSVSSNGNAAVTGTPLPHGVMALITAMVNTAIDDMSFGLVRDCRFSVQKVGRPEGIRWICLDFVEEKDGHGKKLWAHTNDFDGMAGWSECEFSHSTTDKAEAIAKITEFLTGKFNDAERIEVRYVRTPVDGGHLPNLEGDSDNGVSLTEQYEFPSIP